MAGLGARFCGSAIVTLTDQITALVSLSRPSTATMALSTHTTSTGFLLPSIHSAPPFFTFVCHLLRNNHLLTTPAVSQQPNPATQATLTEHWTKLILSYARFRRLFTLRVEDAETGGDNGDWDEVLRNPRINRAYALHFRTLPPL